MPRAPREQPAKPDVAEAPKQEPATLEEKTGVPATPEQPKAQRPHQTQQSSADAVVVEGKVPVLERFVPEPIADEALAKLNVYQRWNRCIDEIGLVPKRGWNNHHQYWFTTDADLNAFVGPLFAKYHLVVIPTITNVERIPPDPPQKQYLTRVFFNVSVINADVPEDRFAVDWMGEGADTVDKGLYKSFTGGLKYFYMKLLQVATGDDPEVFTRTDQLADMAAQASASPAGQQQRQQQSRPVNITPSNRPQPEKGGRQAGVTEVQIRQVRAMTKALGFSMRGLAEFIDKAWDTHLYDTVDGMDQAEPEEVWTAIVNFLKAKDGSDVGKLLYEMGQEQARRVSEQQDPAEPATEPPADNGAPPGYEPV